MSAIKQGDMVMLVWACCAVGRENIGWVGVVERVANGWSDCRCCKNVNRSAHAFVSMNGLKGPVPLSWLKKVDPRQESEGQRHCEELTA